MKATEKAPEIDDFLVQTFGADRRQTVANKRCVLCAQKVAEDSFRDEISRQEYCISGICQSCQDEIFQDV